MQDKNFIQFIEFGRIFDRSTRTYLVDYLQSKVKPSVKSNLQKASLENFEYLKEALDKIFEHENLLKVSQDNDNIANEVISDTLTWLSKAYEKNQVENPYAEEQKELERWHTRPTFMWVRYWYKLTNYLRDIYSKEEIQTKFYEQKFEEITAKINAKFLEEQLKEGQEKYRTQLADLEIVIEDLLNRWQSLLTAKRLKFELENIDKQREEFCKLLYAKIEEFMKLLEIIAPFQEEVGRFWDMSQGLWKDASFDILQKYSDFLAKEDDIRELADMLGRMRKAEIETQEEIYENIVSHKAWVSDESLKEEVTGIHQSNDLSKLIPSEVSLLTYPATESVFYKKYADQQLLTFREEGKKLVESNHITYYTQQKQKRKEKGPFIICVDTSGSMEGTPEHIAKVLCFAILKIASKEQRKAFLISFSIGIRTINLLDLANSMDEVIDFLSMSFHGGTDVTPAMMATIDMLATNDYKDADVLLISDFVMYDIKPEILKRIQQEQQKGTKFHALTISKQANPEIIEALDNNWIYNPEKRGVIREVRKDLEKI